MDWRNAGNLQVGRAERDVILLAMNSRQDVDDAIVSGAHVSLLTIDHSAAGAYLDHVHAGRHTKHLRLAIDLSRLAVLNIVYEDG
jgi:hypothetical protein